MKKAWSCLCVCAMVLTMVPMMALSASAVTTGFNYIVTAGKVEITDYTGSETHLTIPSKLGGYPVTSIGECAIAGCKSLTSVTIPNSVTSIGNYAFAHSKSLQSVTLLNGVTSIGYQAFWDCFALESITIPDSVTSIGNGAFGGCASLQSVTIGNGVTCIENGTFNYCASLASITIPNSVRSIGDGAFRNCDALTSVTIGSSVTSIGDWVFDGCDSLSDVYYGGSQEEWNRISIGDYNSDLTSATIHYTNPVVTITAESDTASYASQGAIVSVTVTAEGDGLTYQWYIKNPGGTKYSKSSVTAATYSTKMTAANSGRLVYCIVKDQYGNEVRSKTFVLRMKATITSESATAAYAKMGAKVSVKVGAVGDDLKYTWYIKNDGGTKYSKSSIMSATYSTTMSDTVKGRRVYCVVKDKYGKIAQTKTFLLREAVSITTQPKTTTTAKGSIARTTVKASGDGLTYTWYIKNEGQTKSSVTKSTYSTTMSSASKNRLVLCVVKDKYGNSVQSTTVKMKMK